MRESGMDPDELDRPDWNSLLNNYDKHDIGEAYFVGRMHQIGLQVENWGIDMRHHDDGLIFDNKMDLRLWEPLGDADQPHEWGTISGDQLIYTEKTLDDDPELYQAAIDEGLHPDEDRIGEESWGLRALADVKTKNNEDWLGVFNLRHLAHYAEHAASVDVPTFIYMTMVDIDAEKVGEQHFVTPITDDWGWEHLVDHYDPDSGVSLSYGDLKDIARECDIVDRTFRAPDGNLVVDTADEYRRNFDYIVENVL